MVVHFRRFLHIDLKRSARADLQLILFASLIVALMVGGTLVILRNLRTRMMKRPVRRDKAALPRPA
jgi:cytochrome o ubiquinol oxidase operon protein cyoD